VSEIVLEEELRKVQAGKRSEAGQGGKIIISFDRATDEFTATFGNGGNPLTKTMKLDNLDLASANLERAA
jgi:hypothetical protein